MATYYISDSGNDANDGLSSGAPILTFAHAKTLMSGGDTIYLERGSEWREYFDVDNGNSSSENTIIDTYGSGDLPIVNGCDLLTGWTNYSGSIYYTTLTREPQQLFANGTRVLQARYPKSGINIVDSISSTTITDNALTQADDYWNGGTLCVRTSDWTWEHEIISDFVASTDTVTVSDSFTYSNTGSGYFIRGLLSELTQAGEWVFVQSENRLYLWMPDSSNPTGATIEVSQRDWGIGDWNAKFITCQNVKFFGQESAGFMAAGGDADSCTISNCTFEAQYNVGIRMQGTGHIASNNTLSDIFGRGIELASGSATISQNTLTNIGLEPGYGVSGNNGMIAIWVNDSTNTTIEKNTITNCGYNGITCNSAIGTITKNIITEPLKELSDGGGIYAWGSDANNLVINGNFIYTPKSNYAGTDSSGPKSWGIYMDMDVNNCTIFDNLVKDSEDGGLLLNSGTNNNNVYNNILLDYTNNGLQIMEWQTTGTTLSNTSTNNVIYSTVSSSLCVSQISSFSTEDNMCFFNKNYFGQPHSTTILEKGGFSSPSTFTLATWQADEASENIGSVYLNNSDITLYENKTDTTSNIGVGTGIQDLDSVTITNVSIPPWDAVLVQGSGGSGSPIIASPITSGGNIIKVGNNILIVK